MLFHMSFFLSLCKDMESVCLSDGQVDFVKSRKWHHITGGPSDAGRRHVWTDRLRVLVVLLLNQRSRSVSVCLMWIWCETENWMFLLLQRKPAAAPSSLACWMLVTPLFLELVIWCCGAQPPSHLLIIISRSLTREVLMLKCTASFYNTTLWQLHLSIHKWNKPVPEILTEIG